MDDFQYASLQELLDDSGVAVVVRVDEVDETVRTGGVDRSFDTDLVNATIVDRLVGADGIPGHIWLASLYLEDDDGPAGSSDPPHRVDAELWRPDLEYLLFLAPFRYPIEPWRDTFTGVGGLQGIFVRAFGSQGGFRPLVPAEVAIAREVRRADVLVLTPGGHPPNPDDD